jgi:hypothetical protein
VAHRVAAGSPQSADGLLKRTAEMKAVVYRSFGGPEVLEYTDVPDPKLSQNGVLVRVRAAALNPADHMLQAGLGESHTDAWFPVIPGWDVAGVVERVGARVSESAPGDEVIGYIRQEILHHGAYAELVSAPVETLVRKPRHEIEEQHRGRSSIPEAYRRSAKGSRSRGEPGCCERPGQSAHRVLDDTGFLEQATECHHPACADRHWQ